MGYSKNIKTLEAMLPELQLLAAGKECEWECTPGTESFNAYKIHEALSIAEGVAPEQYPELARARKLFKIQTEPGKVTARIRQTKGKLTATASIVSNDETFSLATIIHHARHHNVPLHFPNVDISKEELIKLMDWCRNHNPRSLVFWAPPSLTIKEYDPELEALALSPEDL